MNTIAIAATVVPESLGAEPQRAFDFLAGHWHVAHRKLRSRLTGCTDWDEFETIQKAWTLLDGICNTDESFRIGAGAGERPLGSTFRCLDQRTQLWSIYWVSARDGVLGVPPVVGGFVGNVGHFDRDELIGGQMVRVRFIWTVLSTSTSTARWQQAFSLDQGETWEMNWDMAFTRISADVYAAHLAQAKSAAKA